MHATENEVGRDDAAMPPAKRRKGNADGVIEGNLCSDVISISNWSTSMFYSN